MKENIYGVSDEVLEHYNGMNWKIRQSMLNTSVTLGLGPDFVRKVIETCYYGKYPGTRESSDHQIVWDHMKWNSKEAVDIYSLVEFDGRGRIEGAESERRSGMIATVLTLFFMGMTVASRLVFGFSFRQSLVFAPMAFFSCLFAQGGPFEKPEQVT